MDLRFQAGIPDRRGKLLQRSPLLTGVTEDGRRIELGLDGTPELRNSVIRRDPETGEVHIRAPDQPTLDKLIDRERRRAEAEGKTWKRGRQTPVSDQPHVSGSAIVVPGRWERMAAKVSLALLAEAQPPVWRGSPSAALLRATMRNKNRPVSQIRLLSSKAVRSFAAPPATAITVITVGGRPILNVSLLGIFSVRFALADDLNGIDVVWVSDPLEPGRSFTGRLAQVYQRQRALGYL